jgi:hypothetical protein
MARSLAFLVVGTAMVAAGCATPAQFLDSKESMAVRTAVTRGQFELNCPTAAGTVLSKEVIQPPMRGPWVGGGQRGEYTVGVSGCDKNVRDCPDGVRAPWLPAPAVSAPVRLSLPGTEPAASDDGPERVRDLGFSTVMTSTSPPSSRASSSWI